MTTSSPQRTVAPAADEPAEDLTWEDLVRREPDLAVLLERCRAVYQANGPDFWPDPLWYDELKPVMESLVGWDARNPDPVLHSGTAYDLAYDQCYYALLGY